MTRSLVLSSVRLSSSHPISLTVHQLRSSLPLSHSHSASPSFSDVHQLFFFSHLGSTAASLHLHRLRLRPLPPSLRPYIFFCPRAPGWCSAHGLTLKAPDKRREREASERDGRTEEGREGSLLAATKVRSKEEAGATGRQSDVRDASGHLHHLVLPRFGCTQETT